MNELNELISTIKYISTLINQYQPFIYEPNYEPISLVIDQPINQPSLTLINNPY